MPYHNITVSKVPDSIHTLFRLVSTNRQSRQLTHLTLSVIKSVINLRPVSVNSCLSFSFFDSSVCVIRLHQYHMLSLRSQNSPPVIFFIPGPLTKQSPLWITWRRRCYLTTKTNLIQLNFMPAVKNAPTFHKGDQAILQWGALGHITFTLQIQCGQIRPWPPPPPPRLSDRMTVNLQDTLNPSRAVHLIVIGSPKANVKNKSEIQLWEFWNLNRQIGVETLNRPKDAPNLEDYYADTHRSSLCLPDVMVRLHWCRLYSVLLLVDPRTVSVSDTVPASSQCGLDTKSKKKNGSAAPGQT